MSIALTNRIDVVTPPGDKGPVVITVNFENGETFKILDAFRYVEPTEGGSIRPSSRP